MDELHAAAICLRTVGAGVGFERALEVVDERKEIAHDVGGDRLGHALPVALHALAVVVELGRLAQQPIVVVVTLPLQFVRSTTAEPVVGGICRWIVRCCRS